MSEHRRPAMVHPANRTTDRMEQMVDQILDYRDARHARPHWWAETATWGIDEIARLRAEVAEKDAEIEKLRAALREAVEFIRFHGPYEHGGDHIIADADELLCAALSEKE